jgi:hypothetical protein
MIKKILPIGFKVKPWGRIVMVGWVDERYYWFKNKNEISMIPATVVYEQMKLNKVKYDK